jgi:ABC-type transport system substrate-binding protein
MQKVKWIFFGYLALVALVIVGIAVSFAVVPTRDPHSLYTAYGSNIKTLDPGNIGDTTSSSIAGNVFETLYNYDYQARPYKLIPEIASGMPQISVDGLTWTIKLKKGIHYFDPEAKIPGWTPLKDDHGKVLGSEGPEVKAGDFIYAWKRIADFHEASQNYSAIFEDKIEGLGEWRDYTKNTPADKIDWSRPISGFQAVDDYTLRIKLPKPYPQLRYNLAHLPTAPISKAAADFWGDNLKHHPIGTGPYVLHEMLPEQRIVLTANPIYRGGSDVQVGDAIPEDQKLPHIKRLQLDYFAEDLPMWALFRQGLLDIAGIPKDVYTQAINTTTGTLTDEMRADGITLRKEPMSAVFYYGFNMQDPTLGKNKPLRQAMSMAFDRKAYINLFLNGRGEPATGPIPPGFPTYSDAPNPWTQYNVAGANEKMEQARRINGGPIPPITMLMPGTDTTFRQMGEFMKRQMDQIGLDLKIDYTTWSRFQEMIDRRQAQFYALGWVADYPDEQTFLQLFWSKNATPGPNSANYSNPEFDSLYEQSVVMNPGPARDALYRKMQQIVQDDMPWMYNFYPVSYTLSHNWVGNLSNNQYGHGMTKFLTLDESARRAWSEKH